MQLKNVLIGAMAGYIILDVVLGFMGKSRHQSILEKVMANLDSENVLMSVAVAVLGGVLVWYWAKNTKEGFQHVELISNDNNPNIQ